MKATAAEIRSRILILLDKADEKQLRRIYALVRRLIGG